jgi:hypothetical protein
MRKKGPDRDRMKERVRDIQELSGGPFRLGALKRHHQFALLHSAAKARVQGKLDIARGALDRSKAARTGQWVDRLSPMALIERRRQARSERTPE